MLLQLDNNKSIAVGSIPLPNIQVMMSLTPKESTLIKRGENGISRDLIRMDLKSISTWLMKQRITFTVSVEQTTNWNSLLDFIIQV